MKKIIFSLLVCFLFVNPIARAEQSLVDITTIDEYIHREMEADAIPGLALAIVHQGEVFYTQGYGVDGPDNQPVTPDTSFLLGSMSKSFTALAVMQLVEEGLIDLDTPVNQYLPWFTVQGEAEAITVSHLLHHTSGIPENAPRARGHDQSLSAQVRALSSTALMSEPGHIFEYSSPNYLVLGAIVEAVSNQTFAEYVQTNIFDPLDMSHSYTSLSNAREQGVLSSGYQYWFGFPVISNLPEEPGRLPTASLISSVSDLSNYLILQSNGGQWENQSLISPEATQQMHTPDEPNSIYAMGWRNSEINDVSAIHHGGILPNFRGKMVILPDTSWGIAVLTNISSFWGEPSSHRIANSIAAMLVEQSPQPAKTSLATFHWIIRGAALLIVLSVVWNFIRIPAWRAKKQSQLATNPAAKGISSLIFNIAIPIGIIIGFPVVSGLSWETVTVQTPDVAYTIIAVCVLELVINLIKLGLLIPMRHQSLLQPTPS